MTDEQFVKREIYLLDPSEKIALDIGAHIGEFTDLLAKKHKLCYAFEPNQENINRFSSRESNVRLIPKAVSNKDGRTKLYIHTTNPGGHTINEALVGMFWRTDTSKVETVEVETVTIDSFCADMDVGVIKCDVESAEGILFDAALETLQRCNVTILLEVHLTIDLKKLTSLFKSVGYNSFLSETGEYHTGLQRIDHHYMIRRGMVRVPK